MADFGFELKGGKELEKALLELSPNLQKRIRKRGMTKAAARMRTLLRRDAPRRSGKLRKSINVDRKKNRWRKNKNSIVAYVGLASKYYYKLLDLPGVTVKGRRRPWILASMKRHSPEVADLLVKETRLALYNEAGKIYARSRVR